MLFRLFRLFHPYLGWRRIDSSSLSILIMFSGFEQPHRRRSISLSGGVGWLGLRPAVVGPGGSPAWVARDGQGHVVHLWPRCGGWVPEEESHGPWHAEVVCMWKNLSLRHLRPKEIGKTWLNMRNGVLLFSCCKVGEHSLIVRVRFDKMAEGPEFFEFIMSLTLLLDASLLFPDWLDILKTPPRVNQPS